MPVFPPQDDNQKYIKTLANALQGMMISPSAENYCSKLTKDDLSQRKPNCKVRNLKWSWLWRREGNKLECGTWGNFPGFLCFISWLKWSLYGYVCIYQNSSSSLLWLVMCDYASVFKNTIYKKEYFFPKERDLARYRAKFPNGFRIYCCYLDGYFLPSFLAPPG